jgi:hypothetical protein
MLTKRFFLTGLLTSAVNLAFNTLGYILILKHVYRTFPTGSAEFMEQLHRKPGELVLWAMALTTLGMGFFITLVMNWSWARTFATGLKYGAAMGFLFWGSVNFGLYASSHLFSLPAVLVDLVCSGLSMTLSAAFAAWLLGRGKEE